MNKLIIASLIVLICASENFAQKPDFECVIVTLNLDSSNPEVIRKQEGKEIGRFQINETMEEERIIKFFQLPKTRWFVVASLYTTDESLVSKSGIGSLDMELSFARKRKRNIFTSPAYSVSETPFKTFDVARVSTIVQVGGHRQSVTMECKVP